MKKATTLILLLSMVVFASTAFAARGMGGWGAGSKYGRMYNPQTVETVSGEVVKVEKIKPIRGMSYGIHLILKTDSGEIPVHLGPAWYLDNQDIAVSQGDKVEVKGSKVEFNGKPAIIAAEVKKGDKVLKLRDENGYPAWAGQRRGR